jgi:hypothetical protein
MGGQGTLRYAAMLPGYFGSAVGFSSAFPDMQSNVAHAGLNTLPVEGADPNVYEAIFGGQQNPYAEGNSPQALAVNYRHTRIYLTSGNGVNCPEDSPTNPELDALTETLINAQQAPFAAAARAAGRRDRGDDLRGPHRRRLEPRLPRRAVLGLLQAGVRATAELGVSHRGNVRGDVGAALPVRRAAVRGRRVRALRPPALGGRERRGPNPWPEGLSLQQRAAVRAAAVA